MKKLYIARHAKSDWGQEGFSDEQRPLNEAGLIDASSMAKHLSLRGIKVDAIIASKAKRAMTTARAYAQSILDTEDFYEHDAIYQADENDMLSIINEVTDDYDSIMLVGHNPTFSFLVKLLTDQYVDMSAGSIIELDVNVDSWLDAGHKTAQLVNSILPNDI